MRDTVQDDLPVSQASRMRDAVDGEFEDGIFRQKARLHQASEIMTCTSTDNCRWRLRRQGGQWPGRERYSIRRCFADSPWRNVDWHSPQSAKDIEHFKRPDLLVEPVLDRSTQRGNGRRVRPAQLIANDALHEQLRKRATATQRVSGHVSASLKLSASRGCISSASAKKSDSRSIGERRIQVPMDYHGWKGVLLRTPQPACPA